MTTNKNLTTSKNKTMKKSLLLAAAALMAVACSKREINPIPTPSPEGPEGNAGLVSFSAGMTAGTKVSVDNTTNVGASKFDVNDVIGVYALIPSASMDLTAKATTYPTLPNFQFLNKKYKVTTSTWTEDFDAPSSGNDAYVAEFDPNTTGTDEMYYQSGNKAWSFLAYYPTSAITEAAGLVGGLPSIIGDVDVPGNWEKTETDLSFQIQTDILDNGGAKAYPGPIMYAYNDDENEPGDPAVVPLAFKYANAKISLEVKIDGTVGENTQLKAVTLYGVGLLSGYKFDLKQAVGATPENVFVSNTSGSTLTGLVTSGTPVASTRAYQFGFTKVAATTDSVTSVGYLVPATAVTKAKIEFFFDTSGNGSAIERYVAYLDQSATGDSPIKNDGTNFLDKIEPGKEYKFKLSVKKNQVTFSGTIADWDVVDKTGDDPIPAE